VTVVRGVAASLCLLLAGCASVPPAAILDTSWEARSRSLAAAPDWQARGRLSLRTPQDSVQGSFEWRQRPDWVEVRFRGPIGVGGLFVYGPPGSLTAMGRDGQSVVLENPERDLEAMFGFGLPVQSLRWWLLGLADGAYPRRYEFDERGLPVLLAQRGWEMRYSGWRELDGELLPRRVDLVESGLAIRIVLDDWSAGLDPP
jgi:outer membrane lipoprotein LolB